jgi:nitrite reductase (NO-forming)
MNKRNFLAVTALSILSLTSCGSDTSQPAGNNTITATPGPETGASIFKRTCISCHMAAGEGIASTYPPLAKSDFLADKEKTIRQVIKGYSGELTVNGVKYNSAMPAQPLSDDEVATVLTYVYSSFGNSGAPVTADEVKAVRAKQ